MKKLQKISLNVMKNNMSRSEMRIIKAGSGPSSCNCKSAACASRGNELAYCSSPGYYQCC
ncbi:MULTISPECIES: TIGR04149 family rSAM-modified RiPP [Chryseobacterium]|jgi:natural product precursor|uniref:TIGR04149 family rSAM-modified RiPP n=1 Tax=Chryseobacterium TaxID=59732 RepID=UPI000646DA85|nr:MULTISPECIES: TIGR04149 family rSAM-modified RiPP [Chryseobacterium]MBE4950453.1 TIGR04149 family rSAM-modified RiPP [Chryseobacterium culicis]MCW1963717.1 TIGR04149 family rSAM-modified RiPP [Chryseobacterium viscerum]MDR6463773.1 natural product precursor [Chryseobacterium sediminis]WPO91031.1 TIGR04149 family rSAM-modified RiPP [Chryseobacterium sp. HR92]